MNWLRPGGSVEYVNGVAARNFELTSVHFLKRFPPGDPDAFVKLWEQIKEQLSPSATAQPAQPGLRKRLEV